MPLHVGVEPNFSCLEVGQQTFVPRMAGERRETMSMQVPSAGIDTEIPAGDLMLGSPPENGNSNLSSIFVDGFV
jgi:hypothetical protein